MSERFCENCRAGLPKNATACPECGVFAGDVFDGRMPKEKKVRDWTWLTVLLVLGLAAAGWYFWQERSKPAPPVLDTAPVRVVRQRPGGRVNEAEAIRALRRHLAPRVKGECLAVTSQGSSGGAYQLTAFNHCDGTRLGRWVVSGDGAVRGR